LISRSRGTICSTNTFCSCSIAWSWASIRSKIWSASDGPPGGARFSAP
jgi:hypothetical protein